MRGGIVESFLRTDESICNPWLYVMASFSLFFCTANVLCGFQRFMLLSMDRASFCRKLVVVPLSPRASVESISLVVRFLSFRRVSHVCYSVLTGMPVVVAIRETQPAVAPQRSACCGEPLRLLYKRTASAEQFLLLRAILILRLFL